MEKIGFIGLGTMGGPMCTNLLKAGFEVVAFDLMAEALDRQIEAGAAAGSSAADVAGQVDVLMTSLPRPDHVESVMRGNDDEPCRPWFEEYRTVQWSISGSAPDVWMPP